MIIELAQKQTNLMKKSVTKKTFLMRTDNITDMWTKF